MLWGHELQASVSTASSPKISRVSVSITRKKHGEHVSISFGKPREEKKENNLLILIIKI